MTDLVPILQLTLNGMATGAIYALVALGLVITYKATEVLNFAYGDVLMASAFVAWGLIVGLELPFWLAAVLTVAFASVLGWQIDARIMRRIVGQPHFAGVMLTIAIAFMVRGLVSMFFGPESRSYPTPWTQQSTHLGPVVVSDLNLVILAVALVMTLLLYVFLRRTALGVSIQAASQNQLAAWYMGIPVQRLNGLIWGISAAVAAVAGVLLAPITFVHANMGFIGLKAFPAAVVGGFGSLPGAIVGGLVIGVVESLSGFYLPEGFKDIAAYLVVLVMLVVKPNGLFGENLRKKV